MGMMDTQSRRAAHGTSRLRGNIRTLQSVSIEVRNPDISRDFYIETLGMLLASDYDRPGAPLLVQPMDGGAGILLFCLQDDGPFSKRRTELRWTGLSLTTDDVDAVHDRLLARNAQVLQAPQTKPWGVRDCVFADPDGNVFNLVQLLAD
ncbi:MAG: VOC family protein [Planctomycetales bacterium]|nr:VOC family protein [bacterium]UNM08600.1 MAG: VOC family protein [Planctomycetales bacterium]